MAPSGLGAMTLLMHTQLGHRIVIQQQGYLVGNELKIQPVVLEMDLAVKHEDFLVFDPSPSFRWLKRLGY